MSSCCTATSTLSDVDARLASIRARMAALPVCGVITLPKWRPPTPYPQDEETSSDIDSDDDEKYRRPLDRSLWSDRLWMDYIEEDLPDLHPCDICGTLSTLSECMYCDRPVCHNCNAYNRARCLNIHEGQPCAIGKSSCVPSHISIP